MSHGLSICTRAMACFLKSEHVKQCSVLTLPVFGSLSGCSTHTERKINADKAKNKIASLEQ